MATIANDFTIDYVAKRVTHTANTYIYTVNALYSYLQDTFDDLAQLDDTIPMSAQTPTDYTLINGWFMEDTTFKFLKGGAISTNGWNNTVLIINVNDDTAYADAVPTDITKTVTDDAANVGPLLAYELLAGNNQKWWIRDTNSHGAIADNSVMDIPTGTGGGSSNDASGSVTGEGLWPNIYTLGTIEEDDAQQIYIMQADARIFSGTEWWPENGTSTQHIDILIKTREAGTEIDNGQITVFLRHYQADADTADPADLYDHFEIDLSGGGRNAVPLATSNDLNNTSSHASVSTWNDITIAFVNGTIAYSAITDAFTEFETVTSATGTAIFLYQTTTTGAGTMTLGNVQGTFSSGQTITGNTSNETAGASANMVGAYTMDKNFQQQTSYPYSVIIGCSSRTLAQVYEYLKYVTRIGSTFATYPTTYYTQTTHSSVEGQLYIRAHEDTQTSPTNTFTIVKASPFGTFAGGTLFGAQGVWVQDMASSDIQAFQLIDSDGTTRTPPNQITVTVTNTLASDRVAVFLSTGSGQTSVKKDQFLSAANNSTGEAAFIITTAIPSDTPQSGSIRLVDITDTTSDREVRHTYTSWSGSTFSGVSPTLTKLYSASNDTAYVPYIDNEATGTSISSQVIYASDRYVVVRVRRYATTAILPFETTGTITSGGYSVASIRTDDTIVSH